MENKFKFIENPKEQISDIKDYIFRIFSNWKWFLVSIPIALAIAYYVNILKILYNTQMTLIIK